MHFNRTDTNVKWYRENVYLNFLLNVLKRCFEAGVILSVLTFALITYFWTCTLVHTAIYNYYVPSILHKWPVFLLSRNDLPGKYDCPSALVTLDEASKFRNSPPELTFDLSLLEKNVKSMNQECQTQGCSNVASSNVFSRGQAYSTKLHLKVPNTPSNRELGMFKIEISLLDANLQTLYKSARAVRLPHRPKMHQFLYDWFTIANIFLSDGDADNFKIETSLIDAFIDDSMKPVHYANITVFSPRLEWSSASLHFKMKLAGIGYIITHHSFISLIMVMMACGCLFMFLTIISWQRRPKLHKFYELLGEKMDEARLDKSNKNRNKYLTHEQTTGHELMEKMKIRIGDKELSYGDWLAGEVLESESIDDVEDLLANSEIDEDSVLENKPEYNEDELTTEVKVSEIEKMNLKQPSTETPLKKELKIEELPSVNQELLTENQIINEESSDLKPVTEERSISEEPKPMGRNISMLDEQTVERSELSKRDISPPSSEDSFTILNTSDENHE